MSCRRQALSTCGNQCRKKNLIQVFLHLLFLAWSGQVFSFHLGQSVRQELGAFYWWKPRQKSNLSDENVNSRLSLLIKNRPGAGYLLGIMQVVSSRFTIFPTQETYSADRGIKSKYFPHTFLCLNICCHPFVITQNKPNKCYQRIMSKGGFSQPANINMARALYLHIDPGIIKCKQQRVHRKTAETVNVTKLNAGYY